MDVLTTAAIGILGKETADVLKKQSESFLAAALGEPAKAFGGLLSDKINARRHKNLIAITVEAHKRLARAGVKAKEVPLTIIHPALESASLEEDQSLQGIWANLLANAADPRQVKSVLPSFPTILRELISRDVRFLDALYTHASEQLRRQGRNSHVTEIEYAYDELLKIYAQAGLSRQRKLAHITVKDWDDHKEDLKADMSEFNLTLATAIRHRVMTEFQSPQPFKLSGYFDSTRSPNNSYARVPDRIEVKMLRKYVLTHLGSSFLSACMTPEKS
jgi:hypothetical protein